ncbi:MAG: hypothetical protein WKF57_06075 [Nakamurella sp.]
MQSRRFTDRPDRLIQQLCESCPSCGKVSYPTRVDAKRARRSRHPGEKMNVYVCAGNPDVFHLGHLPGAVVRGDAVRDDIWSQSFPQPGRSRR